MLIYIHGFNSSALSFKAGLLRRRMTELRRGCEIACPELSHRPAEAMRELESLVAAHPGAALIGSSLGGFYATRLAEQHGLRAVLVNPAVRPYELLRKHVGPQVNLYTNTRYELTERDVDELRALEADEITPERYLLMVQTGDEVLDHREAVERYSGATRMIIEGGDHGFSSFGEHLDATFRFCGVPEARPATPV